MGVRIGRAAWVGIVLGALALTGCATESGHIDLTNNTEDEVTVQFGDEEAEADLGADGIVTLPKTGGVSILSGECYDGPLTVTYADGRRIELQGPVCGGPELGGRAETVELAHA